MIGSKNGLTLDSLGVVRYDSEKSAFRGEMETEAVRWTQRGDKGEEECGWGRNHEGIRRRMEIDDGRGNRGGTQGKGIVYVEKV